MACSLAPFKDIPESRQDYFTYDERFYEYLGRKYLFEMRLTWLPPKKRTLIPPKISRTYMRYFKGQLFPVGKYS